MWQDVNHRSASLVKPFMKAQNFQFTVFSYLSGATLFHKIALLNKHLRNNLQD